MPSIIPNYVYTFFALVIVSTLLTCTFGVFAISLRPKVEEEQLKNLIEYVAAESCELISTSITHNSTINLTLNMPALIGSQKYWIRLNNDSSQAWIEGGFGSEPFQTELFVFIPGTVSASGLYRSSHGTATLRCEVREAKAWLYISGD